MNFKPVLERVALSYDFPNPESLFIFAALVLVAHSVGKTNALTAFGAQLFFWSRLAYAPVYIVGVPGLRTALWGVSFVGLLQILLQLL